MHFSDMFDVRAIRDEQLREATLLALGLLTEEDQQHLPGWWADAQWICHQYAREHSGALAMRNRLVRPNPQARQPVQVAVCLNDIPEDFAPYRALQASVACARLLAAMTVFHAVAVSRGTAVNARRVSASLLEALRALYRESEETAHVAMSFMRKAPLSLVWSHPVSTLNLSASGHDD